MTGAAAPVLPARRRGRGPSWGLLAFVCVTVLLILFGPQIAPYSATGFNPDVLSPPTPIHPFGTDEFGRDVLSRLVHGARDTLLLAFVCAAVGVMLGVPTGLAAAYFGGLADEVLMRGMDVLMAFPALVLAMLIIVMMGSNPAVVVIAIGIVFWPRSARLVRSVTQGFVRQDFIQSAKGRGESSLYILFREILPNIAAIVLVDFSLRMASAVLLTASLSYLGVGVSPPAPSWGLMVRDGQQYVQLAPWLVIFPCLAIAVFSIGVVLVGDYARRRVSIPDSFG